jgi:2-polyprenyl-3-methyl-5-hydroxy-6-metoxy-1,4-benzoquinol methylase
MTPEASITCRVCKSGQISPAFAANGCTLLRCGDCGFVQVAQQPAAHTLAAIYQEAYFSHNKYRDEQTLLAENRRRLALVGRHLPLGARLLEAGCGAGDFLHAAKPLYDVYGFDLSEAGVSRARARNPELAERIWAGTLEDQALPGESFDGICLWDVIEHVWDPLAVMRQLVDYLKPGGKLLLSTPNIGAPAGVLRVFEHPTLAGLSIYVPTGDIQYAVVQKR